MSPTIDSIEIAERTDKGPRETNQDVVLVKPLPGGGWLVALADGMGGLEAGEIASRTAIDVFEQQVLAGRPPASAVEDANAAVLGRANDTPMGTTLVAALVREAGVRIVNVGDSRAYRLGTQGLAQVTLDHTVRAEAERNGLTGEMDPGSERWSNALTRSLGAGLEVRVDEFGPFELEPGERLLLCSDGLHGTLLHEEMEHCLSSAPNARAAADQLVEMALEGGTYDNVSVVVLHWTAVTKRTEPVNDAVTEPGPDARTVEPGTVVTGTRPVGRAAAKGWDPVRLASLSHRSLPRKPGSLRRILGAVVLAALLVILFVLIR